MNQEPAQPQIVVLTVVRLLGLVAVVGLVGGMWLIHEVGGKADTESLRTMAAQIAVVFTTVGATTGALAGILASTRSAPPVPVQQAYQQGANDTVELMQTAPAPAPPPPLPAAEHPAV